MSLPAWVSAIIVGLLACAPSGPRDVSESDATDAADAAEGDAGAVGGDDGGADGPAGDGDDSAALDVPEPLEGTQAARARGIALYYRERTERMLLAMNRFLLGGEDLREPDRRADARESGESRDARLWPQRQQRLRRRDRAMSSSGLSMPLPHITLPPNEEAAGGLGDLLQLLALAGPSSSPQQCKTIDDSPFGNTWRAFIDEEILGVPWHEVALQLVPSNPDAFRAGFSSWADSMYQLELHHRGAV